MNIANPPSGQKAGLFKSLNSAPKNSIGYCSCFLRLAQPFWLNMLPDSRHGSFALLYMKETDDGRL